MSSTPCLILHNISKQYWLYSRYRQRFGQLLLSPITHKNYAQPFWALRDINLKVEAGEVLGVIGVNGSGKSTLLQIIAGTLQPTTGTVQKSGRLTALLELGAGFHPEFTGRENIFLSGATIGLAEREMRRHFDQIVDFAGIDEFIDQPVKIYSSGMYVRLAFSIATSVDPEILVVDEALAVGDAGFVIKCMNRMRQLREQGTSIILVSHDVQTVRSFCDSVLWLSNGLPRAYGAPFDVTSQYVQSIWEQQSTKISETYFKSGSEALNQNTHDILISLDQRPDLIRWGKGGIRVDGFLMRSGEKSMSGIAEHGKSLNVKVFIRALQNIQSENVGVGIGFRNMKGLDVITSTTIDAGYRLPPLTEGETAEIEFEMDNILAPGDYALVINIEDRSGTRPDYYDYIENSTIFRVVSDTPIFSLVLPNVRQTITVHNQT